MKKCLFPPGLRLLFACIAVTLWLTLDNTFYFFSFSYIGTCLAAGVAWYIKKIKGARYL